MPAIECPPSLTRDVVILLHGIAMNRWCMVPLAKYLKREGYQTISISYPSTRHTLDELAVWLYQHHLKDLFTHPVKIHFVTHSMGGLLVSHVLELYGSQIPIEKLGRTVMLGPPNMGSELADFLAKTPALNSAYKAFYGPAGHELTTQHRELSNPQSTVHMEIGIIAGTSTWHNPFSSLLIPGVHDGCVAVERTKLPDMKDHICIKTTHTFMIYRPAVAYQAAYFLRNGAFDHSR